MDLFGKHKIEIQLKTGTKSQRISSKKTETEIKQMLDKKYGNTWINYKRIRIKK